jgi:hypothetical protein
MLVDYLNGGFCGLGYGIISVRNVLVSLNARVDMFGMWEV